MREKYGIAFSGGGIKSLAQPALIEWLESHDIQPSFLSGTSAGSMVATLYAMGLSVEQIMLELESALHVVEKENLMHVSTLDILFKRGVKHGIINADWLENLIESLCEKYGAHHISDVKIPIALTAVDLYTGTLIVFVSHPEFYENTHRNTIVISDISLSKAIRASMSFPLVFGSLAYRDMALIDGGIRMNCPVPMLKDYGATKTLAFTMRGEIEKDQPINNKLEVADRVFEVMSREAEMRHVAVADYYLNVPVPSVNIFDTGSKDAIYNLGVEAMKRESESLNAFFKAKPTLMNMIKSFIRD